MPAFAYVLLAFRFRLFHICYFCQSQTGPSKVQIYCCQRHISLVFTVLEDPPYFFPAEPFAMARSRFARASVPVAALFATVALIGRRTT